MSCDELQNLILALQDPMSPTADLLTHLNTCAACRSVQAQATQIDALIAALPVPSSAIARQACLNRVLEVGPVIQSVPVTISSRTRSGNHKPFAPLASWLRGMNWQYPAGLAAATLLAVGVWWAIPGKRGPAPEMAEKPRHQLLTQEVDHYVKLSAANTATARMAIWTDWATDIGQESRVIHKVAQPEDMAALAAMFEKTVNRGVVAQAEKMQTVPPAERHAALTTAIDKLAVAMADADALARSAPTVTQKYFTRMSETARDARQILLVKREAGI